MLSKEQSLELSTGQKINGKDALFVLLSCVKTHIDVVNLSLDLQDYEVVKESTDALDECISPLLKLVEKTLK